MGKQVDWYYRRSGCNTCRKMDEFLVAHDVVAKETLSANQARLGPDAAMELAQTVTKIVAARGKSVVELKTKDCDAETLKKYLVGPTGNLRSPVVRKGKTLYVGFHAEAFESMVS